MSAFLFFRLIFDAVKLSPKERGAARLNGGLVAPLAQGNQSIRFPKPEKPAEEIQGGINAGISQTGVTAESQITDDDLPMFQ